MDLSLKADSERLNTVMRQMVKDTEVELEEVNARITELNELLQTKEMSTDRSENASFQIATDERDIKTSIRSNLQKRIATFEAETDNSYTPTGIVTHGSTVELEVISIDGKKPSNMKTNFIMKLVHKDLGQAELGLLAVSCSVGAALLSHQAGDLVEVPAPKGLICYKIVRLY